MTDPHPDDDLLIDLALSEVDEHRRDALTHHLALCEPCRSRYAGVADSVDHVLVAAPRVAPPPGFSTAVLAAMGIPERGEPVRRAPVRWSQWRWAQWRWAQWRWGQWRWAQWRWAQWRWAVAVAAVVALLAGAVGVAIVLDSREPGVEVAAAGPALLTGDGRRVGTVLDSWYDGQRVLVVTLAGAPAGVRYECQLVLADGTRRSGGSWTVDATTGATWVIPRPDASVARLELVTDSRVTWATATLATPGGY